MTKKIELTQDYFALVDDEDYEFLSKFTWLVRINSTGTKAYASIRVPIRNGTTVVDMQSLLMPKKLGFVVNHKDRNGLNNQKSNLRYATVAQNVTNSSSFSKGVSRFRGVRFCGRKWQARIGKEGKSLGYFVSKEKAARAYDEAAIERYGREFAQLNFP